MKKKILFVLVLLTVSCTVFAQDIFEAARANDTTKLAEFLKAGIQIDTTDQRGFTPLIIAVYNENEEASKFLLQKGAAPDAKDKSGNTALMGACFKGYFKLVDLLYQHHAERSTP